MKAAGKVREKPDGLLAPCRMDVCLFSAALCFLRFQPEGVDDCQQDGEAEAENPGEIPHGCCSFPLISRRSCRS